VAPCRPTTAERDSATSRIPRAPSWTRETDRIRQDQERSPQAGQTAGNASDDGGVDPTQPMPMMPIFIEV